MLERMRGALDAMGTMAKLYLPGEARAALLAYGEELDRLRDEVNDLRSKIEKE